EKCLSRGMDDYVAKPIQTAELWAVLARLVGEVPKPNLPPHPEVPEDVVDVEEALARVANDRELLRDMITMFQDVAPKELARIRTALAEQDAITLHRSSHTLKGAIGTFGRREAYAAAQRLEEMAHYGQLTDAPAALAELEEKLARLHPALVALS